MNKGDHPHRNRRRDFIVAATCLLLGCRGASIPRDAGTERPFEPTDVPPLESCGTVQASGTTPFGEFHPNRVITGITWRLSVTCPTYSADFQLIDDTTPIALQFSVDVVDKQPDGGVLLGDMPAKFYVRSPNQGVHADGLATVSAASDTRLWTSGNFDGGPTGNIALTFSVNANGVAVSGSVDATYCQFSSCLDPI